VSARARSARKMAVALVVAALGFGAGQPPSTVKKPVPTPGREHAHLQFQLEEVQTRAVQAENQAADLQEERVRLLDHLKRLLVERNKARAELGELRKDVATIGNSVAQALEEAARWRMEAEQRRAEVSELQQQMAAIPPEPPDLQRVRMGYERERREARRDAEYLWSKEREKLARRHTTELKDVQGRLDTATAQLAALTDELRQVAQTARDTGTKTQQALEQVRRRAAQAEADNQRALEQTRERAARELARTREQAEQAETEWQQRLTAERLAVRRTREDARRQINRAEQAARQERVGLEQLRSGVVVDWAKLYVRVGVLEAQLGHTQEAERAFKYAIQLQPTLASAYYNLGILYDDHLKNGPAAIAAYEQYLLMAPESKDAKTVRGWIQLLKGTEAANQDRQDWNRPGLNGLAKTFKELWG